MLNRDIGRIILAVDRSYFGKYEQLSIEYVCISWDAWLMYDTPGAGSMKWIGAYVADMKVIQRGSLTLWPE